MVNNTSRSQRRLQASSAFSRRRGRCTMTGPQVSQG
jgi:hypothetical protein